MHEVPWLVMRGSVGDEGPLGDYCLTVEGLCKSFGDGPRLYENLHLRIRRGEILVIIGESGIGKSVFLKHLIGLEEPSSGSLWYRTPGPAGLDCPIHLFSEHDMKEIRQEIGMVFQASSLFDWMTVFENIALPLEEHRDRLQRRLERFADYPHELWMLLTRVETPPGAFGEMYRTLREARATLDHSYRELRRAFDSDSEKKGLTEHLARCLGIDQARELVVGRLGPAAESSWTQAGSILKTWSVESLGAILSSVRQNELPPALRSFSSQYEAAAEELQQSYLGVRKVWGQSFGDIAATLVLWWLRRQEPQTGARVPLTTLLAEVIRLEQPQTTDHPPADDPQQNALVRVLIDWLSENALGLPAGEKRRPRALLRHVLRCLKNRPSLLKPLVDSAGADLPPSLRPLVPALEKYRSRVAAMEHQLANELRGESGLLSRGLVLAWLSGHPVPVDRFADSEHLLTRILEGFAPRPEWLGRIARAATVRPGPPALESFLIGFEQFSRTFDRVYGELLAQPSEELLDSFIELNVTGLMSTLKLDPVLDRDKLPSQLSGGMKTRVGLARALAMMPAAVLYDEPTAGLDPVLSQSIAREILELQMAGAVTTSVVVTHDKDLYRTLRQAGRTRMLYLSGGRFLDTQARPVRDRLRWDEPVTPQDIVTAPGQRGYPPNVFIQEFEPRTCPKST